MRSELTKWEIAIKFQTSEDIGDRQKVQPSALRISANEAEGTRPSVLRPARPRSGPVLRPAGCNKRILHPPFLYGASYKNVAVK